MFDFSKGDKVYVLDPDHGDWEPGVVEEVDHDSPAALGPLIVVMTERVVDGMRLLIALPASVANQNLRPRSDSA